jgi:hypothetical protein
LLPKELIASAFVTMLVMLAIVVLTTAESCRRGL